MDLISLIRKQTAKVPLEGRDKEEVIAELVELQVRAGSVKDRDGVLEALYARESKGSTGIGGGVAVPHAKHGDLGEVTLGVGVSRQGIDFEAADGKLVFLVFLVLAGLHNPGPCVAVLADIANLVRVPGVYEQLTTAADTSALIEILQKVLV